MLFVAVFRSAMEVALLFSPSGMVICWNLVEYLVVYIAGMETHNVHFYAKIIHLAGEINVIMVGEVFQEPPSFHVRMAYEHMVGYWIFSERNEASKSNGVPKQLGWADFRGLFVLSYHLCLYAPAQQAQRLKNGGWFGLHY